MSRGKVKKQVNWFFFPYVQNAKSVSGMTFSLNLPFKHWQSYRNIFVATANTSQFGMVARNRNNIWLQAKLKNEDKQILTNPKGDENTRMKARRRMK